MKKRQRDPLYGRICEILESARMGVARSVNTGQVVANWLIGREIVEEEQRGKRRADYGAKLIEELSERLTKDYGKGFSQSLLKEMRTFYLVYDALLGEKGGRAKSHAVRGLLGEEKKSHAVRGFLRGGEKMEIFHAARGESGLRALERGEWRPGWLHTGLSWTHYRTLLRVEGEEARGFYEIEATRGNWSARELERQIDSLLYERLAMSKDKKGVMRLARKGHEPQTAKDVFLDPVMLEFLGVPETPVMVESELEGRLIGNLQAFLMELGRGFAFVRRQERITLDGDHFYVDLVFYHTVLKRFILIDLKVGKLTHEDLGQLQLYVNYYDEERRTAGDGPTLGLILCTDKNDAVVRYTLGREKRNIFASRYKLLLPSEAELRAEIRRAMR